MEICIDFDGTCVKHQFPNLGEDCPHAVMVLNRLVSSGHKLILFTMRSDIKDPKSEDKSLYLEGGEYLTQAVNWFKNKGIPLYGVQTNPTQKTWTHSPKAYGQLYIDDAALGCPLIYPKDKKQRPFVDWVKVASLLEEKGII